MLDKNYNPYEESEIYKIWLEKGYFKASPTPNKKPYTIMIPPPNITDRLHIGHALNNTIQDIFIRYHRMGGHDALWVPGTDHAAISTEVIVTKSLAKEGVTKESLGREGFLEKVWEWNEIYGGAIIEQLKRLGCSCDWDRQRFTMDEGLSDAVLEAFVRLYDEGKIYRGERLVNWCTNCGTSISDAEVEHEDKEGQLYHFKYPVEGGFIEFATTRPETMLGDTAIAVSPEDERYTQYIGKFAEVPMVGRKIPIIADDYVDPAYGTGVVKVTPGHDPNDFEIGQRHGLPRINIMNNDGTINANGGTYEGLTREEARKKIIEDMKQRDLYVKTQSITHAVGAHDRCGTIVEPLMKLQWFVKMDELAKPAADAYTSGRLRFNRERFGKVYMHWLDNIRDWCISRQLWWGHRIPAYYCPDGHITVSKTTPELCAECGSTEIKQDNDVLDTWFSSALWPFSTLGWPEKTPDLEYFYPTNVLVTAQEIIFFWVVRMVFMGEKFMGELPFKDVFINGTVRDEQGRKMSKSLGNGINPLEVVDEFGADVLRLMLVNGNALDNDTRFFRERLEHSRNFLNKLWNASRFLLMQFETQNPEDVPKQMPETIRAEDKWILSHLNALVKEVTEKLDEHELGMSAQLTVDFFWDEFCDWYVEMVKHRLYNNEDKTEALWTLKHVLTNSLKLLHPFTPFITETIFLKLQPEEETIMLAPWPVHNEVLAFGKEENDIEMIKAAVRSIRNIRLEKDVPPSKKIKIIAVCEEAAFGSFKQNQGFFAALSNADEVRILNSAENIPDLCVSAVTPGAVLYLPLDNLIDYEKERARLEKERQKLAGEVSRVDKKLSNEGFVKKAPAHLIAEEEEKRKKYQAMLNNVTEQLKAL